MSTHLFGIRHHGPGSARSLRQALEALEPDIVLVEGPPDADGVLPLLSHAEMKPPVAILVYDPEVPDRAVYYPFAIYSPEWQAIHYAQKRQIPVRFMDLPQTNRIAQAVAEEAAAKAEMEKFLAELEKAQAEGVTATPEVTDDPVKDENASPDEQEMQLRFDPLQAIAEAAGYADGETWWEQVVEERRDAADQFTAIRDMMTTLRESSPIPDPTHEQQREAWMRQTIRTAEKEGFQKIAVVCGAWHTPALAKMPPAKEDADILKGLPKIKTTATWIPWTYSRLTYASGYGAGIRSPAWYEHLWDHSEHVIARWMTRVAALLRKEYLPASTASVIESVRLANALAAVRERHLPGLPELMESAQSVFCFGSDLPMRLVQEKLVVGERLGKVPDVTPMLPIQQDLRAEQRRLRMKVGADFEDVDYDLRNATDLQRSHLLHRLNLLGIPWGTLQRHGGGRGSFHEYWRLQWQPEFEVRLIEANVWGNSVIQAASNKTKDAADKADQLPQLTGLVDSTLKAELPEAISHLMNRLENLAALTSDIPVMMDALPPLANVLQYSELDVRKTDLETAAHVVDGLVTRIVVGLPSACSSLDDTAAGEMFGRIMKTHSVVSLLQREAYSNQWNGALQTLANMENLHGLIAGRACRLLLDGGVYEADEVGRRLNLALSTATDPPKAAAWIDGLLRDSGEVLLHTDSLWQIVDAWVVSLTPETFTQLLPLLRRTFSSFPAPLRLQLGERVKSGPGATRTVSGRTTDNYDPERGERVFPLIAKLLGLG